MGKAERYRERAEGLRNVADDLPDGNTKRMLLRVAREYDRLAGVFEMDAIPDDPLDALAAMKKPGETN